MKKLMMMLLLAGSVVFARAQDAKKPAATKLPKALVQQLNLTADQQGKVDVIVKAKAARLDSLNALGDKIDAKSLRKNRKSINDEAVGKIDNVLNDDQKKIYADFREAQMAKNKAKKAAGETTTPPAEKQ